MKATRLATVMAPEATRNPPTPSTTRNDTCMATPATGTTSAEILATSMPMSKAPLASFSTLAISRSVALEARTVRTELMARSTAAARSPTLACARALAWRMQHGVDDEHGDERADERERTADGLDETLREHGAQQRGVAADAGDEVARAAGVELRDGQVQHARDESAAARQHDALTRALQQVVLVAGDDRRHDDERDERPDETTQPVALAHDRDHLRHEQRLRQGGGRAEDRQADHEVEHLLVLEEIGQQLAEGGARPLGGVATAPEGAAAGGGRARGLRG
jgi:hypothetical protein